MKLELSFLPFFQGEQCEQVKLIKTSNDLNLDTSIRAQNALSVINISSFTMPK